MTIFIDAKSLEDAHYKNGYQFLKKIRLMKPVFGKILCLFCLAFVQVARMHSNGHSNPGLCAVSLLPYFSCRLGVPAPLAKHLLPKHLRRR